MKQEQIARLENIINKDYSNMAGMTILKDGAKSSTGIVRAF